MEERRVEGEIEPPADSLQEKEPQQIAPVKAAAGLLILSLICSLWILGRAFFGWGDIIAAYSPRGLLSLSTNEARFLIVLTCVQSLLIATLMKISPPRVGAVLLQAMRDLLVRPSRMYLLLSAFGATMACVFAMTTTGLHSITEDEKTYLFQADLLQSGHLMSEPVPAEASSFMQPFIVTHDGRWSGQYFWAQPAILLVFRALGSPWLASALELGLTIWFASNAAAKLFDDQRVGLLTALLLATSPFSVLNAATILNVNLAATCIAASLWAIVTLRAAPSRAGTIVLALSTGIALHNRPLDHAAVLLPVGVWLLLERPRALFATIKRYLPAILLVVPFLLAMPLINKAVSGNPMRNGYAMFNGGNGWKTMGFGIGPFNHEQTPSTAAAKTITNVVRVAVYMTGSVIVVAAAGLGALFAPSRTSSARGALLLIIASFYAAYFFYTATPIAPAGPVYFVSIAPVVGAWMAASLVSLHDALRAAPGGATWLPTALVGLTAISVVTFWPSAILELHRVATETPAARAERLVADYGVHHALIFMAPPPTSTIDVWEFFPPLPKPSFDDDVLYCRAVDARSSARVAARFGVGRDIYLVEPNVPPTLARFDPISSATLRLPPPPP